MGAIENAVHALLDVAAGRVNLTAGEADEHHEAVEPGYTAVPLTDAEKAQLADLAARQQSEDQAAAKVAAEVEA